MPRNIKSERVRLGMTQEQVAKSVGVHINAVRIWESEESKPNSFNLIALSKLFGCSPDYLLGLTDERK